MFRQSHFTIYNPRPKTSSIESEELKNMLKLTEEIAEGPPRFRMNGTVRSPQKDEDAVGANVSGMPSRCMSRTNNNTIATLASHTRPPAERRCCQKRKGM
ncbi:hypothetical protein CEP51_002183 [Fusarium floridanum]|uniref:Uncharacterized protein n=1 Tax=Fusarium floridanum TaxID=1325733 RepID=A0A428SCL1_9HYPO|nr:hypothetical protein CEP51_002183 [Fusarium floridanum]